MSQRTEFSKDFSKNKQRIDELLQIDKSFDLLYRVVIIGGKKACFYFVDGFCKDEIMEKVLEFLYKIKPEEMPETAHDFLNEKLPYGEIDYSNYDLSKFTIYIKGSKGNSFTISQII